MVRIGRDWNTHVFCLFILLMDTVEAVSELRQLLLLTQTRNVSYLRGQLDNQAC